MVRVLAGGRSGQLNRPSGAGFGLPLPDEDLLVVARGYSDGVDIEDNVHARHPVLGALGPVQDTAAVGGNVLDEGDVDAQFDQAIATLQGVLAQGGASLRSVLKVNVLLTRAQDVAAMNLRYAAVFGAEPYPARTTSVVQALPDPRMLLEIECIAVAEAVA